MTSLPSRDPILPCEKTHWLTVCTGPNVPVDAISYRIRALRKEGAALGISNDNSPTPAKSLQVKRTASSSGKQSSSNRKRKAPLSDDSE